MKEKKNTVARIKINRFFVFIMSPLSYSCSIGRKGRWFCLQKNHEKEW
jgi:cell division protein FtsB